MDPHTLAEGTLSDNGRQVTTDPRVAEEPRAPGHGPARSLPGTPSPLHTSVGRPSRNGHLQRRFGLPSRPGHLSGKSVPSRVPGEIETTARDTFARRSGGHQGQKISVAAADHLSWPESPGQGETAPSAAKGGRQDTEHSRRQTRRAGCTGEGQIAPDGEHRPPRHPQQLWNLPPSLAHQCNVTDLRRDVVRRSSHGDAHVLLSQCRGIAKPIMHHDRAMPSPLAVMRCGVFPSGGTPAHQGMPNSWLDVAADVRRAATGPADEGTSPTGFGIDLATAVLFPVSGMPLFGWGTDR